MLAFTQHFAKKMRKSRFTMYFFAQLVRDVDVWWPVESLVNERYDISEDPEIYCVVYHGRGDSEYEIESVTLSRGLPAVSAVWNRAWDKLVCSRYITEHQSFIYIAMPPV